MNLSTFFDYPETQTAKGQSKNRTDLAFLPHWSHAHWTRLFHHCQTLRCAAGDQLISRGAEDPTVYLVALGRFEIRSARGRVGVVEPGSIFGEQSFLDGQPHTLAVHALTDAEVVALRRQAFETFTAREPELARDLLFDLGRLLSLRLRALMVS